MGQGAIGATGGSGIVLGAKEGEQLGGGSVAEMPGGRVEAACRGEPRLGARPILEAVPQCRQEGRGSDLGGRGGEPASLVMCPQAPLQGLPLTSKPGTELAPSEDVEYTNTRGDVGPGPPGARARAACRGGLGSGAGHVCVYTCICTMYAHTHKHARTHAAGVPVRLRV